MTEETNQPQKRPRGRPRRNHEVVREGVSPARHHKMLALAMAAAAPVRGNHAALTRHIVFTDEIHEHIIQTPVKTPWHSPIRRAHKRSDEGPHVYRVYVSDYQQPSNPVVNPSRRRQMTTRQLKATTLGRHIARDAYVDLEDVVSAIYRACPIPTPLSSQTLWNPESARALRTAYQRPEFQAYGHCTPLLVYLTTLAPQCIRNPSRATRIPHRVVQWMTATLPNPRYAATALPTVHGAGWAAPIPTVVAALRHMISPAAKYTAWQPIVYCVRRNNPKAWTDQVKAKVLPQFLRDAITAVADELQRIRDSHYPGRGLPANLAPARSDIPVRNREDSRRLAHKDPHPERSQSLLRLSRADPMPNDEDDGDERMDAAALADLARQMAAFEAEFLGTTAPPDLSTEAQPEWV